MSKIAELHNGMQLHFPDDTKDEHIDAAVQHHLAFQQKDAHHLDHLTTLATAGAALVEAVNNLNTTVKELGAAFIASKNQPGA